MREKETSWERDMAKEKRYCLMEIYMKEVTTMVNDMEK